MLVADELYKKFICHYFYRLNISQLIVI